MSEPPIEDRLRSAFAVEPGAEADRRARTAALEAFAADRASAVARTRVRARRRPRLRRALLAAAAVLLLPSTALAATWPTASRSIPGEPLYPLKLAVERAQLALAFGPAADASVYLAWAEHRLEEARRAQALANASAEADALARHAQALAAFELAASDLPDDHPLFARAAISFARQTEILTELLATAPDPARPGLARALDAVERHGPPASIPPGAPAGAGAAPEAEAPSVGPGRPPQAGGGDAERAPTPTAGPTATPAPTPARPIAVPTGPPSAIPAPSP